MILVKNKLKKKKVMDDDDMLNYLKFSHLDTSKRSRIIREDDGSKTFENKSTQFPETQDKATQTIGTEDKGVDTYDELNKIVGDYILHGNNTNVNKNDKMVQVNTQMLKGTDSKSPPSSSGSEGFPSKMARGGFRLAEFALNTAITTANLTMALSDALVDLTSAPHQSEEEEEQQQEVISVHSSPPQTINSSSSDVIEISSSGSSRQTQTSIPQPTSP